MIKHYRTVEEVLADPQARRFFRFLQAFRLVEWVFLIALLLASLFLIVWRYSPEIPRAPQVIKLKPLKRSKHFQPYDAHMGRDA